jgi:microcystin degradation protein MlrC
VRAAGVLKSILDGVDSKAAVLRLPMIVTGELTETGSPVLSPVFQLLENLEADPNILSAGVLMAQPWLDVPDLGWCVFVYSDADIELAENQAEKIAEMCWQRRDQLQMEFLNPEQSIETALSSPGQPVVEADGADATNSGACGDRVHLLRELIKHKIPGGALNIMVDPEAVARAKSAGVGGQFQFSVGGKRDHIFSQPLPVKGEVLAIRPARYILSGHGADQLPIDMGDSATVKIGDVTLLLVQKTGPGSSPMMYRCVGLEPKAFKIVVVKSPAGFRAAFGPFASAIVLSACPGCASPRLTEIPYRRVSRPLWPLDMIKDWRKVRWAGRIS